jgi:phosphoribosylamine--glycine ligase
MENDLLDVLEACVDGRLEEIELVFSDKAAVCVVLASAGYPAQYEKGLPISGLESFVWKNDCFCYHAGTRQENATVVTNGGRVIGITALGADLAEELQKAYRAAAEVCYENKYMRTDSAAQ